MRVPGVRSGDGRPVTLRGPDDKLGALVRDGMTARGKKRFLAIGNGAVAFRVAMKGIYPTSRQHHCWLNVLNGLPVLSQPEAKGQSHDIPFSRDIAVHYPVGQRAGTDQR